MSDHDRARTVYRLLLHAYPKAYRERYGDEMEEAFIALLRLDERSGALGRARCWIGATWDASIQGTAERLGWSQKGRTGAVGETMGSIMTDVHYALRSLRRRPVFAATAIVTIALGIGANASVFTVVDGFMFTPLPYQVSDLRPTRQVEGVQFLGTVQHHRGDGVVPLDVDRFWHVHLLATTAIHRTVGRGSSG